MFADLDRSGSTWGNCLNKLTCNDGMAAASNSPPRFLEAAAGVAAPYMAAVTLYFGQRSKTVGKKKMARNGGKGGVTGQAGSQNCFFQERLYSDPVCNFSILPSGPMPFCRTTTAWFVTLLLPSSWF